jgi:oligopeptide transport system ATP-binding protein
VLHRVGLPPQIYAGRRPHELSGGQCQRVAIARAIAPAPALVICDEATSSLDVLVQAQVLSLFEALRTELRLSYLFISHDLAVVQRISDRVAVMHRGQLCEIGDTTELYERPHHPYTVALLASSTHVRSRRPVPPLPAVQSNETQMSELRTAGCRFRSRCPRAIARCAVASPLLQSCGSDHFVACHSPVPG